jgi:uncharacterized phage-associated protein
MAIQSTNQVLDVCSQIIKYCNDKKYYIDNLKLQKLLYFIEARYLCLNKGEKACFHEEIYAWTYGPVVPQAYSEYKEYGSAGIIPKKAPNQSKGKICNADMEIINSVIDEMIKYSGRQLISITHSQRPWLDVYVEGQKGSKISKESIYAYFSE